MKLQRSTGAALSVALMVFAGAALAAGQTTSDKATVDRAAADKAVAQQQLAVTVATCAACHGETGVASNAKYPDLAGQKPGYLLKALQDFKSGARPSAVMQPFAAMLDTSQMKAIAAYFAKQKTAKPKAADGGLARAGKIVFTAKGQGHPSCVACHGGGGLLGGMMGRVMGGGMMGHGMAKTDPAITPKLAAQSPDYIKATLDAFASDARHDPVMTPIASTLTETEREAVAAYLAGLKG